MTGKIESGSLSLDKGIAQYMELFTALANAQLKGLMLQVEYLHKQHEGSDENCRHYVSQAVDLYKDRIDRQAEEFLNGLERLLVLFAAGDSTRDYHTSSVFPVDGGSKYYARFDALVGDMVGADSQVVVRLLWDAKKAEQYPTFFAFMNERLSKLENPEQPLELQLDDHGGTIISPVTGKENGTVNPVERKKIGEETVTKAVVRRYLFRNFRRGEPLYSLTAKREHLDVFNLERSAIPLPGSVGPFLLPYNGHQGTELLKVPTYDDDAHRYITIPLFAWLPETLMLDVGNPILDGPHFEGMGYQPLEMRRYCYGIRSHSVGKYVQIEIVYPGDRVAACSAERDGALAHRLDPTAETTLPVRYGDGVISILGTKADPKFPAAYFHLEKVNVTYLPQYQYYLYHLLPAPTLVERFIDPLEARIVREDIPFRLRGIQAWKLAAAGSHNWIYPVNVHDGTVPPEELFYFVRVVW